ncbi:eIF-2B domain protein [Natronomonas moolapensis 8.8.11]|uniref:EIF-2B domain protein n=1 Tax=Natronomonas moolapensis (strain DSM 18674 / CECT 7526 / JCM 14361 / 8.8.11) TaxID=268739 RepID=M1XKI8_NATM8|nr:translation initiation factor eIF-2B [Natronomonas moolapensis]CCQ35973.1 eIF-2B domain protein [Natronomonas moolapensis 8.8.11]
MIDETVDEIREMQTHSSSVVAVKAAEALRELLDREFATVEEYARSLERNASALQRAQPSHASLYNTQREIVSRIEGGEFDTIEAAKVETDAAIDDVVESVERAKHEAATNAVHLLPDGTTVLTHDYSSTVVEAIELAAREGHHIDVYVSEARPRYLGRRTARTLAAIDRVETTLIVDGAAGQYLDECDRVLLGMSAIVEDTLYNRVGTFPIAATAAELAVPVSVVGASEKLIEEGFVFENEFRSPAEVMREPAEGFSVANPAYDATPAHLLDGVVTETGTEKLG